MRKFNFELFKTPNTRFGLMLVLFEWSMTLFFGYLSLRWQWFWPICLVLFGRAQLILDNIGHYAGHQTLFRSPRSNEALSFLYFFPVFTTKSEWYDDEHRKHHRKLGAPDDPGMLTYKRWGLKKYGLMRAFFLVPFSEFGLNLRLINIARNWKLLSFWTSIALLAVLFGFWWPIVLWLISFFTTRMYFIFISEVSEHYKTAENHFQKWDMGSRILASPLSILFKYPWDKFHWFHHEFPKIPPNRITAAFKQYVREGFAVPTGQSLREMYQEIS